MMKKYKKFLSVLCAVGMAMAMTVPTFAASGSEINSSTPSTQVYVDTNNQTQTVNWPITDSHGFYKVWFSNTASSSTIRVALYKGNTSGNAINYIDVPAGQAMSLHNANANSPLATDTYYIVLTVIGGAQNLNGLCFYKNATTYANVVSPSPSDSTAAAASGNKLTLDDIKKNYTDAKILNITKINADFVLVESEQDTFANKFALYNLKTGDIDVLPTMPEYVTLKKAVNENYFIFVDSGKNSESVFSSFPSILKCFRVSSGTNKSDNFTQEHENEYYDLNMSVQSGSKEGSVLSVIKVTFDGLEVMFKPKSADDAGFYADATDIPPTTTSYDSSTNKLTFEIATSLLGENLKTNVDINTDDNLYISSYRIVQKDNKTYIVASLKNTANRYIMKNNIGAYFPYFSVNFAGKSYIPSDY